MKYLIIYLLLTFLFHDAFSQVTGKVTTAKGQPVQFASVTLLKNADSTLVKAALTSDKGTFLLDNIGTGKYILRVTGVSYQAWTSSVFELTIDQQTKDFGTLVIREVNNQLGEVVIRADKPLVQQRAGGLVVNVQSSIMTKGSSVLQILERSPGVVVDPQNTSITLNGKSGVMVMLDGKLMRMSLAQVLSLLNGMSADDIEKIELLTTPPAKYDADGNAGLINIVTKKSKKPGTSGSATTTIGYGKGGKASADLSLNHNSGKFSLHGSYSYNHDRSYGLLLAEGTENVPIIGGQTAFHYNGEGNPVSDYYGFNIGIDYRASSNTTIGGNVYYSLSNNQDNSHNFGNYALPDSNLKFDSYLTGKSNSRYLHPSVYLEQTFRQDQKLNLDLDYFDHHNNDPTQVQSNFRDSLFGTRQRNLANTDIKVAVAKLDFINPFNKQLKLESGLKGTYTRSHSTSGIENFTGGQWIAVGAGTSNDLSTKEVIGAGYAELSWQPDSITTLSAGARYEYSHNSTDHSLNALYVVDRRLGKLFPSFFVTRKLNTTDELQLSYTERISRPSFADLASYISYNDPVSVFTGNPTLKPTVTHNLKLAYSLHDYLFSLLYSRDIDPILGTQVMPGPTKGLVYLIPENGDWQNNLTFQATIPVKATAWWEMNYGFVGGFRRYRISYFPEPLEKSYFSYSMNFAESFKLTKNYAIELSGYYNSSSYSGNSRSNGNATFNLGFKKELNNNNGSFQLSVSDIFRAASYYSQLGLLTTDTFNSNVAVNYQAESHSFPVVKLSYFRTLGSNIKKASHKNNGTKDEQDRL